MSAMQWCKIVVGGIGPCDEDITKGQSCGMSLLGTAVQWLESVRDLSVGNFPHLV